MHPEYTQAYTLLRASSNIKFTPVLSTVWVENQWGVKGKVAYDANNVKNGIMKINANEWMI